MSRSMKQEMGVCYAYQRGKCERGDTCKYNHVSGGLYGKKTSFGDDDMMITDSGELSTPRGPTKEKKVRRYI